MVPDMGLHGCKPGPTSTLRSLTIFLMIARAHAHAYASPGLPFVANTWSGPFTIATDAAFEALSSAGGQVPSSALDAVQAGCSACEKAQCDGTVGWGGSPDESCETTLDALIMDGATLKSGAVAGLRRIRDAIAVARAVLDHTTHSILAGDFATEFAVQNGFEEHDLSSADSEEACRKWREDSKCQPNYRLHVSPDPTTSCGPYVALQPEQSSRSVLAISQAQTSHDTISMITISASGAMAAGTSTNGASHKIPGRVGDGPVVGSGSYVDSDVGGCGATGDGDIMLRFLPCYQAVENLRRGMTPTQAAENSVARILRKYPSVSSGIVVANNKGEHGGAGSGWTFSYSFRGAGMNATQVVSVAPLSVAASLSRGLRSAGPEAGDTQLVMSSGPVF